MSHSGPVDYHFDAEIIAEKGSISIRRCSITVDEDEQHFSFGDAPPDTSWRGDTTDFIETVAAGASEHPPAFAMIDISKVVDALYASAREHRPICLE